jgi:lysophospholipase L1-like esterase
VAANKFLLKKNDRVVFYGDSITEQQLYTNYVETYLTTRYPELKLRFFNAGWGGDTTPGGLGRLQRDVLVLRPTVVTLCFGMNDGKYTTASDSICSTFAAGLEGIVQRLLGQGVRVAMLTPGMAEAAAAADPAAMGDYNAKNLRALADIALAIARKHKLPACDIHELMNRTAAAAYKADPAIRFTAEGVHPDPDGHLIMAMGLLQALGVPAWHQTTTVRVPRRSTGDDLIRLTYQVKALPFHVEHAARKALPFLAFRQTYNDHRLAVKGLPAGRWYWQLGDLAPAATTAERLAAGVAVDGIAGSEAGKRAMTLHQFTLDKDQTYYKFWRNYGFTPDYDRKAHEAGVAISEQFELARSLLLHLPRQTISLSRHDLTRLAGEGDFIRRWNLLGPFPKPWEADHLGGEAAFSARAPTRKALRKWQPTMININTPGNNLCEVFGPQTDCLAYALVMLDSPVEQQAELLMGSDDGLAVWLNGRQVCMNLVQARPLTVDEERMAVRLRKGPNVLLAKIAQGAGNWAFLARFRGVKRPLKVRT